jgi:AraC-like DNA-binding protein
MQRLTKANLGAVPGSRAIGTKSSNTNVVSALQRSKLFKSYERVFTNATGLPLTLRPLVYWQLAHRGKKHENAFCALLSQQPATLAVCLHAHEELIRRTHKMPQSITCPFGLTETAVPVRLGQETIGFLRIGQVLRRAPRVEDNRKVNNAMARCGVPFSKKLHEAWEKNPLVPTEKYAAIGRLLTFFAEQLSSHSNQLVTEASRPEPPLVVKARDFIEKHKTEDLSLGTVASAAGASVFHFCKVLHASTGLKFTDYLARVRVEDAHEKLLDPTRRISEVAFTAGFNSLTQFNRTFRRVFGESPTEFRAKLTPGRSRRFG